MSKNVYYIDDSSSSTHLATLKNLLEEIATEYFYSYTLADDNSALDCFVNTGTVEQPNLFGLLRFEMVSGKISAIRYGANGVSKSDSSYSTPAYYIQRITKTDYGIAFKLVAGTTLTFRDGLYITKSNNGETAVCATSYLHTSSNTANILPALEIHMKLQMYL